MTDGKLIFNKIIREQLDANFCCTMINIPRKWVDIFFLFKSDVKVDNYTAN